MSTPSLARAGVFLYQPFHIFSIYRDNGPQSVAVRTLQSSTYGAVRGCYLDPSSRSGMPFSKVPEGDLPGSRPTSRVSRVFWNRTSLSDDHCAFYLSYRSQPI